MHSSRDSRDLYHQTYFLAHVDGHDQFNGFDGSPSTLFYRARRNFEILAPEAGEHVLEVGCGRGEWAIAAAERGAIVVAVDYSPQALSLARSKATEVAGSMKSGRSLRFVLADICELRVMPGSFDKAYASEVIEHLSHAEARRVVHSVFEALRPGGQFLVFSHPNRLRRKIGYPFLRWYARVAAGQVLPAQEPDTTAEHYLRYHLNEYSLNGLRELLTSTGFQTRVWFDCDASVGGERYKRVMRTPLRSLFGTDLVALCQKGP